MLPPREIGLAAAAYHVEALPDWAALKAKLARWIRQAADARTDIAVLPEYAGMEAALAGHDGTHLDPPGWCARAAEVAGDYAELCAGLAAEYGLWLLSGSLPALHGGTLVNRAWLCLPDGSSHPVDKQVLTPWERANTPLQPGLPPRVFQTVFGRLAVLICYDSEFPVLSAALKPDILLVPSTTETLAGLTRVRTAARARALESQCIAVHAPLVGQAAACDIISESCGRAAICAPPDWPFPLDGLLAQTGLGDEGWCMARLAAGALSENRQHGGVAPRAHSSEAASRAAQAELVDLQQLGP